MKASKMSLRVYRSLYWANQGLLQAIRSLEELHGDPEEMESCPEPELLHDRLRRTQAMIEETRLLMNRSLGEWCEIKE